MLFLYNINMLKLGVLQGRLSKPIDNCIQEFPKDTWKKEFDLLLNELQLNHIEWLITKNSFSDNPLFKEDLSKFPISSICCDNLIDDNIDYPWFLSNNLDPVCESAIKNNIKNITIPLLEESNMENDDKRESFCDVIKKYGEKYKKLNFTFEAELYPLKLLEIIDLSDNFYVTYDTGNITSCGFSHNYYLYYLHHKINNIHLKDRNFKGESFSPGKGNTDFELIFQLLKKYKYDGFYTMQTAREGISGDEINTVLKHKNYFLKLLMK